MLIDLAAILNCNAFSAAPSIINENPKNVLIQSHRYLSCLVLTAKLFMDTTTAYVATVVHYRHRGARKLIGDNLKLVWAEFSTLS